MIPHEPDEYNIQFLWGYPKYVPLHHLFVVSYFPQNSVPDSLHEYEPSLVYYFIKFPVNQDVRPHHKNFESHLQEFLCVPQLWMYDQITLDEVHTKQHEP